DAQMKVMKRFLSSREGATLSATAKLNETGELLESLFQGERAQSALRRLSSVMQEEAITHIDLLKIDVEGAELDVLQGIDAGDWPKIDQLVIEVDSKGGQVLDEITTLLRGHGYYVGVEEDEALAGTGVYNVYARRLGIPATVSSAGPQSDDAKGMVAGLPKQGLVPLLASGHG